MLVAPCKKILKYTKLPSRGSHRRNFIMPTIKPKAPIARPEVKTPIIKPSNVQNFGPQGDEMPQQGGAVSRQSQTSETRMAVVNFIAGRANSYVEHVIPSSEGSKRYKELYKAETAKPEAEQVKTIAKVNNKGERTSEMIPLVEKYNLTNLRSFFEDAYNEIYAANYTKVILSEAKPETLIVKSLLDRDSVSDFEYGTLNSKLTENAVFSDIESGIFGVKRKDLVAIMLSTDARHIPVLVNSTDPTRPDGVIITKKLKAKNNTKAGASAGKGKKKRRQNPLSLVDLRYLSRDPITSVHEEVKSLLEMGMKYAVNKDYTVNKGSIGDINKIVNKKQVEALYGENFDYMALGVTKKPNKSDYPSDEAYAEAMKACDVQFGDTGLGAKFAEIGLTAQNVTDLRNKSSKPRKRVSTETLYDDHIKLMHELVVAMGE